MSTLVLGATGTVGGAVVTGLLKQGASVSALSRSPERAGALPAGVETRIGDLTDPQGVGPAFADVESLFLLNGVTQTELQEGLVALEWARHHGVRRVVYVSVHSVERGPHIPHFASKIVIEQAIKASGLDYTILQPNNFFQNDYWFKDAMQQYGVYPQPLGDKGLDRVDTRDIADAAVAALTGDRARNQTIILAGPDTLTGVGTADIWARALGRAVAYGGNDLDQWEQQQRQYLPGWMVFDFKIMYRWFQEHGLTVTAAEREAAESLIGHPFRSFDDFARETAALWQA